MNKVKKMEGLCNKKLKLHPFSYLSFKAITFLNKGFAFLFLHPILLPY